MKSVLIWTEGMKFEATAGGKSVSMDANPPKQPLGSFEVEVEVETTKSGYPILFTKGMIVFKATGDIDPDSFGISSLVTDEVWRCQCHAV